MKRLLVAAALAPLAFAAAHAQTTVSTATTTQLTTSGSGDITITSTGSITPTTSATAGNVAVTINSNNSVDNEGAITVTESTTGGGTNQGIADGPFANGFGRFGIQVSGAGPFTGNITNGSTGTITIIGENSAGIDVETGLNGGINDAGTITVTGGNITQNATTPITFTPTTDVTYGIFSAQGATVSGNVTVSGAITATGANATGVALNGDVGGGLDIANTITATGYRSTTPPTDQATLDALRGDQIAQGGPALSVGGNIAGGIVIAAPVAAAGNIAASPGGHLVVFGAAPALLIGGNQTITIGNTTVGNATSGFSLTVAGDITGNGTYPNVNGAAIQIGGANPLFVSSDGVAPGGNFSAVFLAGGIDVSGNVTAASVANTTGKGVTTAIEIGGAGTGVNGITVTGSVVATGANTLTTGTPGPVTAIKIDSGATAGIIINGGNITAAVTGVTGVAGFTQSAGGTIGNATAISDVGGGLSDIINSGNITASITPVITGAAFTGNTTAIYEGGSNDALVAQCNTFDCAGGNVTVTPSITGDVDLVGSGNYTVDLFAGTLTGAMNFGNNTGSVLDIEGGALAKGAVTVASGGELALSIGAGNFTSGTLFITSPGNISLSSLNIATGNLSTGTLIVTGDLGNLTGSTLNVAGNATLGTGPNASARVGVALTQPLITATTFTVIETGAGNLTIGNLTADQLTFLDAATFTNIGNTTLSVTLTPRTAASLGFNPAEAAMLTPFIKALGSDPVLSADVLSKTDRGSLVHVYDQFLPDYAGGPFETLVSGQQGIARAEAETPLKLQTDTTRGWVQEIGVLANKDSTPQVNGYQSTGFGFAAGVERARGDSAIGVAAAFITDGVQDHSQPSTQSLTASAFEVGLYWRKGDGQRGLNVNASLNGGLVSMGSRRYFIDTTNSDDVSATPGTAITRTAKAGWLGGIVSVNAGAGYQINAGRFYARPEISGGYVMLFEPGYHERGGGPAFNLSIASRTSSQVDAQADLVLGMNFGDTTVWRPELMIGYRATVVGGPASTVANFTGGSTFTLNPQYTDKGGFLGRLGVRATGQYADFSADAGGEFRSGYQTYNARAAARFLF